MSTPSPRSLGGGAAAYHVRRGRVPNPQGPPPPLPNGIPFLARDYRARLADATDGSPITPSRVLRGGSYLARYTPLQTSVTTPGAVYYLGTVRVQTQDSTVTISGDLYLRRVGESRPEPDPGDGIPVFPRSDYRFYLRATEVADAPGSQESFTLGLELFRFSSAAGSWTNDAVLKAVMSWTTAPPGYPTTGDYLTGELKNTSGAVSGTLTLGWVSPFLRRASVEIDRVAGGVMPMKNVTDGAGLDWRGVFKPVGWDVTVVPSDTDVAEPTGESWSDAEMHATMIKSREQLAQLLDREWRYHILCVRRIDETERGIMYDSSGTDSNSTPREGVGIASDWVYPQEAVWGDVQGKRFGDDAETYFRTAVHELGHALGLYHNTADNGFMNTTDTIARRARPERPFPRNIRWGFHPDDERRLRHMPDAWVRPGGVQFGEDYSVAPIAADDLIEPPEGLALSLTAVQEVLPLGAPARLEIALVNSSELPVLAPAKLTFRGGDIRGKVIDPAGTVRSFIPLVQCVESQPLAELPSGGSLTHSVTILRGPQGALFPGAGLYRIVVEVYWSEGSVTRGLSADASLLVAAAQTPGQAQAAYDVLTSPETLSTIALSVESDEADSAISAATADPTLGPHYLWLDAKRLLRSKDVNVCMRGLERLREGPEPIVTSAERRRAAQVLATLEDQGLEQAGMAAAGAAAVVARRRTSGKKGSPAERAKDRSTEAVVDADLLRPLRRIASADRQRS
jgi:hypothetical protein